MYKTEPEDESVKDESDNSMLMPKSLSLISPFELSNMF